MDRVNRIKQDYFAEAGEIIDKLVNTILSLEVTPRNRGIVDTIYRDVHSLKGITAFIGFTEAAKSLHIMENSLNAIRKRKTPPKQKTIDELLSTLDDVKTFLEKAELDDSTNPQNTVSDKKVAETSQKADQREEQSPQAAQDPNQGKSKTQAKSAFPSQKEATPAEGQSGHILKPLELPDDMKDLLGEFLTESTEILEKLDNDFLKLEQLQEEDPQLLNDIFRAAHTLKGISGFFNFTTITQVSHAAENVLNKLRKAEISISNQIIDCLLETFDLVKMLVEDIRNGQIREMDVGSYVLKLKSISGDTSSSAGVKAASQTASASENKSDSPAHLQQTPQVQSSVSQKAQDVKPREFPLRTEQTIRVDVDKIDKLVDWVGELILGRNRLHQLTSKLMKKYRKETLNQDIDEVVSQIGLATNNLQNIIMKTRMIPLSRVFNKYPRMVRDLSRSSEKKINLEISGETTEVDKSVAEEISDPLVHLIRNCVDHGIEPPDERTKTKKPAEGTISLSSYQEGNQIVIRVSDDGRGIDPDTVRKKAIEKGIISSSKANLLSLRDTYGLIFAPGFSTAAKVTNISGRGVGMDVVKHNIEKLNGIIDIQSEINHGTTMILKIPLTLAIIRALVVNVSDSFFAVPLSSIIEVIKIPKVSIRYVDDYGTISYKDSLLPLARMTEIFQLQEKPLPDNVYIVIMGLAEKRCGFIIDSFVDHQEIVIKTLGKHLQNIEGISGATILGNGTITLIVDVAGLFNLTFKHREKHSENVTT